MRDKLKPFLSIQNAIVLIGVLIAVILGIVAVWTGDTNQVLAAILVVLGALASAMIVDGYSNTVYRKKLDSVEESLELLLSRRTTPDLETREILKPLAAWAPEAHNITIVGRSLSIILWQSEYFRERLDGGATVRMVLMDHRNEGLLDAVARISGWEQGSLNASFETAQQQLQRISRLAGESSELEIRTLDAIMTMSFVSIDQGRPNASIIVEFLPYRVDPDRRPHLLLTATEHPEWYRYFLSVIDSIWNDAEAWTGS